MTHDFGQTGFLEIEPDLIEEFEPVRNVISHDLAMRSGISLIYS
jgi:hypothetical protein